MRNFAVILFVLLTAVQSFAGPLETARARGSRANEALVRSKSVTDAWMARRSENTGLLPRSGGNDTWYIRDSAADLFPYLAICAWMLEPERFRGEMMALLRDEIRHSTRVSWLSDNVKAKGGFEHEEINLDRIIFGSCEYAKDGLLPLVEYLNHPAFYDRLAGIAEDMIAQSPYTSRFGRVPSRTTEVNGEFLQVLSRLAWRTNDPWYVESALKIADFYFKQVIPGSGGLPADEWDIGSGRPARDEFHFNDHGNEIAGGLSELVLYLVENDHPRADEFVRPLASLIDRLLEVGLNADGVWIMSANLDGTPKDSLHAHCWGYLFNAVYTTYLITGDERYLAAVQRALEAVTGKPAYLDDPDGGGRDWGSNAYSDAIESAIVLLNRLPDERTEAVMDAAVTRFLARQHSDGIVEDWYGDGNYVRTALMYALMQSGGCWLERWREDLALGATLDGDTLVLAVESEKPWSGVVHFDYPRHREHWNMSVNYPRLNEWPEWYTVERNQLYEVEIAGGEQKIFSGQQLIDGLPVSIGAMQVLQVRVTPLGEPPYGGK
ncbi:MAG: hypothetical protein FVQ81_10010 [Candidatus Glassbacteria bacterium]|nr:hypothetical protein [Candidatus Glassbacteria bacterium]